MSGFISSASTARTINLNASTVNVSSSSTPWDMATSTNATLNAGTSTINLSSGTGTTFAGGGLTYYTLAFTNTSSTSGDRTITGANTFTNLTFSTIASAVATNVKLWVIISSPGERLRLAIATLSAAVPEETAKVLVFPI